jgi:hypothetical protein
VLDREREMTDQASDLAEVGMPFHYNTIAYKLLEQCVPNLSAPAARFRWLTRALAVCLIRAKDDIEAEATGEVHTCRKLLRDIEDVRMSKIRKGTRMVMDEVKKKDHVHDVSSLINFRNLTFTELNNNRPPLKKALDTLADINPRAVSRHPAPSATASFRLSAHRKHCWRRANHRSQRTVDTHWAVVQQLRPMRNRSRRTMLRGGNFAGTDRVSASVAMQQARTCVGCTVFSTAQQAAREAIIYSAAAVIRPESPAASAPPRRCRA